MSSAVIGTRSHRLRAHRVLMNKSRDYRRQSRRLAHRVRGLTVALAAIAVCDVGLVLGRTGSADWEPASRLVAVAIATDPTTVAARRDEANRALLEHSKVVARRWLATARAIRGMLDVAVSSR